MSVIFQPVLSKKVAEFITSQTVLTLAVCENNIPYTAMCYYVYLPEQNIVVFKSSPDTKHIEIALKNPVIAAAIRQDSLNKMNVQGVQFSGKLITDNKELSSLGKKKYYAKYPFALAISGEIWIVQPDTIKFTENKMGLMGKEEYTISND